MATLNLEHYRGPDAYSEGAVEDELLEIVRGRREEIPALLDRDRRWPILYHLSPARRALLEWYPFAPGARVLEIGAGCGALTGLLCEKAARVTAVELAEKRSRIVFHRHVAAPNLEVLAGNVMDMPLDAAFDRVTLVGVLEYAPSFVHSPRPAADLLRRAGALLAPGGCLLLAVENRLGLKYFAGAREDHSGRFFEGIEGYPAEAAAVTYARDELAALLAEAGFAACRWHYPHPDYKFPSEIFSDDRLPAPNHKFANAPNYDRDRFQLFSEPKALFQVVERGLFPLFANAFLVEAARG